MSFVRDVTSKTVKMVAPDAKIRTVLKELVDDPIGVVVVTQEGKPEGIVTVRDIARLASYSGLIGAGGIKKVLDFPIRQIMSKHLVTASPETPVGEAFEVVLRRKIRQLPVVEKEKLIGIVTDRALFKAVVVE